MGFIRKTLFIALPAITICIAASAQNPLLNDDSEYKPFKHMEVGVTAGTTGIGLDVATPINKNINIRAGFAVMPPITKSWAYPMASVNSSSTELSSERINNLVQYLRDLTGYQDIDDCVLIQKKFQFWNAKLLVDWYPFKKKKFHFTAGVYCGRKQYAEAYNDPSESTTMVAINIYNNMYDQIKDLDEFSYPTITIGNYSFALDPEQGQKVKDAFNRYGRIAVTCGYYPDGTPYNLTPDPDGVIRAHAESFTIKPYLGCGYTTNIGYDKRWTLGVELGVLVWSSNNTHVYTSDNVCLVHDIDKCDWKDIKLLKHLPVYPNLEVRLGYTIF